MTKSLLIEIGFIAVDVAYMAMFAAGAAALLLIPAIVIAYHSAI